MIVSLIWLISYNGVSRLQVSHDSLVTASPFVSLINSLDPVILIEYHHLSSVWLLDSFTIIFPSNSYLSNVSIISSCLVRSLGFSLGLEISGRQFQSLDSTLTEESVEESDISLGQFSDYESDQDETGFEDDYSSHPEEDDLSSKFSANFNLSTPELSSTDESDTESNAT